MIFKIAEFKNRIVNQAFLKAPKISQAIQENDEVAETVYSRMVSLVPGALGLFMRVLTFFHFSTGSDSSNNSST